MSEKTEKPVSKPVSFVVNKRLAVSLEKLDNARSGLANAVHRLKTSNDQLEQKVRR